MLRKVEKEQLKVPAHIDYLGDLRDFVTQVGKKHGFSPKVINAFKLAIDEAATNIIRHAYRDNEGLITIRAIVKKGGLTISIIDQGTYFDPKRVKDPDLNRYIDIGKKGGLGIFIMRKLMDEIDYRRTEEGNELRITKQRDAPEKEKFTKKVSSIPLSIKVKFFFRTIAIISLLIAAIYSYSYIRADDLVLDNFVSDTRITNTQIINRLNALIAQYGYIEDLSGQQVYEDYKDQIYRLSVEDNSGIIEYSNHLDEQLEKFARPGVAAEILPGVYRYALENGDTVYEFEKEITLRRTGRTYGKAHILVSAERPDQEIAANRFNDLRFALTIWGASIAGVALIIYLVMSPLHKLSEWIKDLGHGEIHDEIDIDASSEIGEIAQAFSDITQKFRESQKNLADQERLQKEMQVAQDIQQTLLPMEFPELEGYELASYYEAAKEVGGDYYDFVEVDKDTLGIAVADVSGKGVPGSLVMTMIRTALRTEARGLKDAAEVLARVNDFVSNDIKKGMFVTIFYLIVDSKKRRINYASAGHNPMILYRGSTRKTYYLNPRGFPIGIQLPQKDLFRRSIQSETIQLAKDDVLLVYTDGITEAMNPSRDLFGEERLLQTIRQHGNLEVTEFVENLKNEIYSFTEGNQQYDDISLVAVKEKSTREEDELRRAREAHRLISEGMSIREAFNSVNLTTYAYYNKYKRIFEEGGIDDVEVDEEVSVEAKHLSIEEKTKIFDIIANHPEYGPGKISEELNTEKYNFAKISENKIYDELVRSRLNTRQLREAYINKSKRTNRRPKPPGTPLMTLDGKLIVDRTPREALSIKKEPVPEVKASPDREESERQEQPGEATDSVQIESDEVLESLDSESQVRPPAAEAQDRPDTAVEADALLDSPIDELLSKEPEETATANRANEDDSLGRTVETEEGVEQSENSQDEITEKLRTDSSIVDENRTESVPPLEPETGERPVETSMLDDFSFDQLFEEKAIFEEESFEEDDDVLVGQDEAVQELEIDGHRQLEYPEVQAQSFPEPKNGSKEKQEEEETSATRKKDRHGQVKGDDGISFADLIQALDEEIVYVSDDAGGPNVKRASQNGARSKEGIEEPPALKAPTGTEVAQAQSPPKTEPQQRPGKSGQQLAEKERVLLGGIKFYKNKDYDNAIREFRLVIKEYPDYKEAYSILGNAYFRNNMYREAADAYNKVKEIDPGDVAAFENMGVIYANRGDMKSAVSEWKRVLELNPERQDIANKIKRALRTL